ncbi:MAG: tetratricopeptide repeat protein [Caulobacteraceae bacterium]
MIHAFAKSPRRKPRAPDPPRSRIRRPPPALLERARGLARAAADEAAKRAYLDVLRRDPTSLPALLELARLALRGGHRSAARTAYQQAIFCHPDDPTARVNLGNLLIESGEFHAARAEFEAAVGAQPALAAAHQGLARVLTALGEAQLAAEHWRQAFGAGGLAPQPFGGEGAGVPVLLLVSASGGNIPTRSLLDDTVFAVTALYAEHHDPALPLPPHALVFNAIGDADLCAGALACARGIVARSSSPVINLPALVGDTGRAAISRRLGRLQDVVAPRTILARRADLLAGADIEGGRYRLPAPVPFARIPHRPALRAGGAAPGAGDGHRRSAGRGAAGHRAARRPRRRRPLPQVPDDADRTARPIRCISPSRPTGRCTTSPPTWRATRRTAPKKPRSWPTCAR